MRGDLFLFRPPAACWRAHRNVSASSSAGWWARSTKWRLCLRAFPKSKRPDRSIRPSKTLQSVAGSARLGDRGFRQFFLGDLALQVDRPWRQFALAGLEQEGIEAAAVVDGL